MSLPKFIVGMTFALTLVAGWSYFHGASAGTIVVRAIICAVVIQAGYVLLVLAMIARSAPAGKIRGTERNLLVDEASQAGKLGAGRSLH